MILCCSLSGHPRTSQNCLRNVSNTRLWRPSLSSRDCTKFSLTSKTFSIKIDNRQASGSHIQILAGIERSHGVAREKSCVDISATHTQEQEHIGGLPK